MKMSEIVGREHMILRTGATMLAFLYGTSACGQGQSQEPFGVPQESRNRPVETATNVWSVTSEFWSEGRTCVAEGMIGREGVKLIAYPNDGGVNLQVTARQFWFNGRLPRPIRVAFDNQPDLQFPQALALDGGGVSISIPNGRYFLNDLAQASQMAVTVGMERVTIPLHGREDLVRKMQRCWQGDATLEGPIE